MTSLTILLEAIKGFDTAGATHWATQAMQEQVSPVEALDAVSGLMKEIGDRFASGDVWLPELIGTAVAAQAGLAIVEQEITRSRAQVERLGTVVIGTVFGDIHSIGKTMVTAMLSANGFKVIDLGMNVPSAAFIKAVTEHQPDILAMSALLTTTAPEQRKVIEALREAGIRDQVKVMVGGGAITAQFAKQIGADGYGATAVDAVCLATQLMGK